MQSLNEAGQKLVALVAEEHAVSQGAVNHLLLALAAGNGRQAQFNHPDLGGMGQWSQGGMTQVGDMFDTALKAKVDAICRDLASALEESSLFSAPAQEQGSTASMRQGQSQGSNPSGAAQPVAGGGRWPAELGSPASTGSQNDLHYAVFPDSRRLAIERGGKVTVYDTGDHRISGFGQQQGGGQSLTFTSQRGVVRLDHLETVSAAAKQEPPSAPPTAQPQDGEAAPAPAQASSAELSAGSHDAVFSHLERLAELRKKDVISAEEFDAKKAELLARL